uniref:Uncharacterized protein n=1 Tax=Oryza sativa subsp. japonica TaxID=39947 RepID=Q5VPM7_ORYSJ|nr:hypothetical protein [Oryza sativa Japonica Group]
MRDTKTRVQYTWLVKFHMAYDGVSPIPISRSLLPSASRTQVSGGSGAAQGTRRTSGSRRHRSTSPLPSPHLPSGLPSCPLDLSFPSPELVPSTSPSGGANDARGGAQARTPDHAARTRRPVRLRQGLSNWRGCSKGATAGETGKGAAAGEVAARAWRPARLRQRRGGRRGCRRGVSRSTIHAIFDGVLIMCNICFCQIDGCLVFLVLIGAPEGSETGDDLAPHQQSEAGAGGEVRGRGWGRSSPTRPRSALLPSLCVWDADSNLEGVQIWYEWLCKDYFLYEKVSYGN